MIPLAPLDTSLVLTVQVPKRQGVKKASLNHVTRITIPSRVGALVHTLWNPKRTSSSLGGPQSKTAHPTPLGATAPQISHAQPLRGGAQTANSHLVGVNVVLCVNSQILPFVCPATVTSTVVAARGGQSTVFQVAGLQGALSSFNTCNKV
jgi:hypothetical protein